MGSPLGRFVSLLCLHLAVFSIGVRAELPALQNLSTLDGSNGFTLLGVDAFDNLGNSVAGVGDLNGDGLVDVAVGASGANPGGRPNAGECYVLFGSPGGTYSAALDPAALDGTNGFTVIGANAGHRIGSAVRGGGDLNADGVSDLVLGSSAAAGEAGEVYVVFGSTTGFPATLDLATLDGVNGLVLAGFEEQGLAGRSADIAGDVNGDDIDDLVIGAPQVSPSGRVFAGQCYVVFGSSTGSPASIALASLDGTNGFALNGVSADDSCGWSVAGAGDVNGDGLSDVVLGAPAGKGFVVFGSESAFPAAFELSSLDGTNGFALPSLGTSDGFGTSVGAEDVNGDGLTDVLIGAPFADPGGVANAGEAYVVFGSVASYPPSFDLASLDGSNGFVVVGTGLSDTVGTESPAPAT